MTEHGWTRDGHRCCDQAAGPRPPRVARCGGPAICRECASDAAIRHSPGSGTFAAPTSPSEPAAKITPTLRLERTKLVERPSGTEFVDGWLNDAQGHTLAALSLPTQFWEALESALSASVEPVPSTPRVWAMPEIPEDVSAVRDAGGWTWKRVHPQLWAHVGVDDPHPYDIGWLMGLRGPLTEVEETNDAD